ncbi:MAG: hypothetical protein P4L84_34095 [Isosphaeraceae bacterium]|nr:hypothetical protein [Isosphaeraceae bacterium]
MMSPDERRRLHSLQQPRCSLEFVRELYGLDLPKDDALWRDFRFWLGRRGKLDGAADDDVNRHQFELFLQSKELVPKRWAALRVGMTEDSLDRVFARLQSDGLSLRYHASPHVVGRRLERDLIDLFNEFRFRTFVDHNDFCSRLHEAFVASFDIEIEPVFCATALELGRKPPDYAHDVDAITLLPVSLRYQFWLDFRKPLSLRPECCSKLFYFDNADELRPFLAGGRDVDIPEEILAVRSEVAR